MFGPASIAQEKLARDQYTNSFAPNNMDRSTIYAPVPTTQVMVARDKCGGFGSLFPLPDDISFRDPTSDPGIPVTIGSILGGFAFLLLLAALAYFLWRVRQGRVHVERISLSNTVRRMSF